MAEWVKIQVTDEEFRQLFAIGLLPIDPDKLLAIKPGRIEHFAHYVVRRALRQMMVEGLERAIHDRDYVAARHRQRLMEARRRGLIVLNGGESA